jgi:hypothetical protein
MQIKGRFNMKKIILIIFLFSFNILYAQNDSVYNSIERFFITPTINYNLPGIGGKLILGYNISEHFTILLSSGYNALFVNSSSGLQQYEFDNIANDYKETFYSNAKYTRQFILVDLSLRYNFDVLGIRSYVLYQIGWNDFFNEGTFNVTLQTKYRNSNQVIETKTGKSADIYNYSKTHSSFGEGLGVGVFVPLTDLLKLDISCSALRLGNTSIITLGTGLNFAIK